MENNNSNKPAFSVAIKDNGNAKHPDAMGLTKREYFAGLALQGILSNQNANPTREEHIKNICEDSIKLADELLKQLEIK